MENFLFYIIFLLKVTALDFVRPLTLSDIILILTFCFSIIYKNKNYRRGQSLLTFLWYEIKYFQGK